jgi:hypothetical protein
MRQQRVIKKCIKPLSEYLSETPTLVSYPQGKGGNKIYVRKDSFKTGINLSGYGQCHWKGFVQMCFGDMNKEVSAR